MGFLAFHAAEERDWFGPPFISLVCDIPASGKYTVSIDAVRGPTLGKVQLFRNEAPVGEAVDFYAASRSKSELIALGTLAFEEGPANLMFKLVGRNEQSSGLGLDLVSIQLDRVE